MRIETIKQLTDTLEAHAIRVVISKGVPSLDCPRDLPQRESILAHVLPACKRFKAELLQWFGSSPLPPKMTKLQADYARECRRNAPVVYAPDSEQHLRNRVICELIERAAGRAVYYLLSSGLVERMGRDNLRQSIRGVPLEATCVCCTGDHEWTRLPVAIRLDV